MLDEDLAQLYGAETKRLNEQVKRNQERFPRDFVFRLTRKEAEPLRSQNATSKQARPLRSQNATLKKGRGGRRYLPYVYTEHGALMAANVLKTERAVAMSIYVVRAFVRLREVFIVNQILEKRLTEIEKVLLSHDVSLRDLYRKIKPLLLPATSKPKRWIGFRA